MISQVVDKLLPIDANVLCDIIDYFCGATILVRKDFELHNVTLPRSWFISLLPNWKNNDSRSNNDIVASVARLIKFLGQLLDRMGSGKDLRGWKTRSMIDVIVVILTHIIVDHLLHDNSNLDRLFIQRAAFISRM